MNINLKELVRHYALEYSEASILVTDTSGTIIFYNEYAGKALEKEIAEGRLVMDVIGDVLPFGDFNEISAHFSQQKKWDGTNSANNGASRVFQIKIRREFISEAETECLFFIIRDITQYFESTRLTDTLSLRIRQAMDAASLAWWEWHIPSNVVEFDPRKAGLLGYNPEELDPDVYAFTSMIHPDDYEKAMQAMRDHLQGKATRYETEYRIRTKTGGYKWLYDRGEITEYTDDGNPKRLIGVVFDITDRIVAEQTIKENEKKYRTLFESGNDAIFLVETETDAILEANENAYKMLGYTREKLGSMNYSKLSPPMEESKDENITSSLEFQDQIQFEHNLIRADGTRLPVEIISKPLYINHVNTRLHFVRDISDRKKAEAERDLLIEELRAAKETIQAEADSLKSLNNKLSGSEEKLKELNATKDKFFSIIAHDLKNPFNTLVTMTEYLVNNYDFLPKEDQLDEIKGLKKASNNAYKLLENLLNWSRAQTGRINYEPEEHDISELVSNNLFLFKDTAAKKEIEFEGNVEINTLAYFDYQMIYTVIRNLISNAIKFTGRGGKIEINSCETDEMLEIEVKDNGIGLSQSEADKLFRIDQSLSKSGTEQERGTGLGLIISKEFIDIHGGDIYCTSSPGEGSSFRFTIPKRRIGDE